MEQTPAVTTTSSTPQHQIVSAPRCPECHQRMLRYHRHDGLPIDWVCPGDLYGLVSGDIIDDTGGDFVKDSA